MFYEEKEVEEIVKENKDGVMRLKLKLDPPVKNADGTEDVAEVIDLPSWEYEAAKTETKSDATTARHSRTLVVVEAIYNILKRFNLKTKDIQYVLQVLLWKLQCVEEKAVNDALGVSDRNDIRISDWDKTK